MDGKAPVMLGVGSVTGRYQPYVPVEDGVMPSAVSLEAEVPRVTVRERRYSRVYVATFLAVLRNSVSLELL